MGIVHLSVEQLSLKANGAGSATVTVVKLYTTFNPKQLFMGNLHGLMASNGTITHLNT